jgi:hypothetical protein
MKRDKTLHFNSDWLLTDDFSEDAGVGAFPPMGAPALHWPGGNRKNLFFKASPVICARQIMP